MKMKANFNNAKVAALALGLLACKAKSGTTELGNAGERRALLETLGRDVIASTYKEFAAEMATLEEAAARYADSLSDDDRSAAQAAFRAAMLTWERAEMYQVGPAARISSQTPGGQGLRNDIYSWPSRNTCGAAAALLDQSYADADSFAASQFPDTRALDTLELMLFDSGDDAHCTRAAVVPAEQWDALVASGDLPKRRAGYARTVAQLVHVKADALVAAFDAFLPELATAGSGSKLFMSTQDGLNALTDALFYIETETTNMKLGVPADMKSAEAAELALSGLSREAAAANLQAFIDIYAHPGSPAPGSLKDLLESVSATALATDLASLADTALSDVNAITPSLEEAASSGAPSLGKAYDSAQELSLRLKTDFLTTLALSLPMSAATDND